MAVTFSTDPLLPREEGRPVDGPEMRQPVTGQQDEDAHLQPHQPGLRLAHQVRRPQVEQGDGGHRDQGGRGGPQGLDEVLVEVGAEGDQHEGDAGDRVEVEPPHHHEAPAGGEDLAQRGVAGVPGLGAAGDDHEGEGREHHHPAGDEVGEQGGRPRLVHRQAREGEDAAADHGAHAEGDAGDEAYLVLGLTPVNALVILPWPGPGIRCRQVSPLVAAGNRLLQLRQVVLEPGRDTRSRSGPSGP